MTMEDKPRVVVTSRSHRADGVQRDLPFTRDQMPTDALLQLRQHAWGEYCKLSLPSAAEEAWRRTDLRLLPVQSIRPLLPDTNPDLPPVPLHLTWPLATDVRGGQVIMSPGEDGSTRLDKTISEKGVIFTDLQTAIRNHGELVGRMAGELVRPEEGKFAALATAFARNGLLLYVPKGVRVEQPLFSLYWGPGAHLAHFSHILVWVDEGASVTYIHESASPDDVEPSMHAGVVSIKVGDGADLKFVELQSWGRSVWNFTHERASIGRDASLDWIFAAVGSRLTKNFSDIDLNGEGATGRMSGFFFTNGDQHFDHDTQQNHLAAHTTSDLLFKGALKGHSRSVWQGMIYVAPSAQKADGYQSNRNLLLSPDAHADSIPGLEILADDVRCTHGATVGRLENEPLYYLKSRGIPAADAEKLMVEGFFDPIMQRILFEGVRERFQQVIREKMISE